GGTGRQAARAVDGRGELDVPAGGRGERGANVERHLVPVRLATGGPDRAAADLGRAGHVGRDRGEGGRGADGSEEARGSGCVDGQATRAVEGLREGDASGDIGGGQGDAGAERDRVVVRLTRGRVDVRGQGGGAARV